MGKPPIPTRSSDWLCTSFRFLRAVCAGRLSYIDRRIREPTLTKSHLHMSKLCYVPDDILANPPDHHYDQPWSVTDNIATEAPALPHSSPSHRHQLPLSGFPGTSFSSASACPL